MSGAAPVRWVVYFDGLCEPDNPGGCMSFGWVLWTKDPMDGEPREGGGYVMPKPDNTNNVAEYSALYLGLKAAAEARLAAGGDYAGLLVHGDSKLVCEQVRGAWHTNSPRLHTARVACLELLAKLEPWEIAHVPRERNERADELSRAAYVDAMGSVPPERPRKVKR